jgi:acetyl esterase/lipase
VRRSTVRYGTHHAQMADVWRPDGASTDRPVVVLIHGGFWRQIYTKRLMHGLARAVVAEGWVAYNIEYRRVGRLGSGGWPETFHDVSDALNELANVEGIDLRRIATCGHSAGGHLALWAGSSRQAGVREEPQTQLIRPAAAISLAGVVDLVEAARLNLGSGAVGSFMGGGPEQFPDRYALGSPAALLPLGIPQFLIHGLDDSTVPATLSAAYAERALSLGDEAEYIPLPGTSHMDMIDPHGLAFAEIKLRLASIF